MKSVVFRYEKEIDIPLSIRCDECRLPTLNGRRVEDQFRRCIAFYGVIAPGEATAALSETLVERLP